MGRPPSASTYWESSPNASIGRVLPGWMPRACLSDAYSAASAAGSRSVDNSIEPGTGAIGPEISDRPVASWVSPSTPTTTASTTAANVAVADTAKRGACPGRNRVVAKSMSAIHIAEPLTAVA